MSWRTTSLTITMIGVIATLTVVTLIPKGKQHDVPSLHRKLATFLDIQVLLAMGITVLGPAAFFTSITYIAPMITELPGYTGHSVPVWIGTVHR